ncbi:MAG: c-type cytochrome biogenesis protein CcmI [Burkholderiales bacterium RIFCSPLOWO2_12_FULL_61_40]|nr:MAG: c-type cytochrome biogenesis protein CcmI [Burkholderiales bacterium RIFCSPLOWO2_12_FULL_61_40]
MIGFIAATAILTLLVVAWMARALLRPTTEIGVSSQRLNAAIYRDQLQALERDLVRGTISPQDYASTQDELKLRLLDDTEETPSSPSMRETGFLTARRTAAAIALALPLGAAGMYWWLGNPSAIDPLATRTASNEKVIQMVDTLAARLKANPDNPKGWAMLARSYKVMGRWEEAEQAFANAGDAVNTDADLLVEYADLLATRANSIEGKPLELINKALLAEPKHPTGLMMSGIAAYRRSDFSTAVVQWEKLLAVLEPGSPDAQQIEADIADARAKMGSPALNQVKPQGTKTQTGADANTGQLPPIDSGSGGPMTQEKINQMVERLAKRLESNPQDLAGWAQLARAYKVQGRLAEAEQAYVKAGKLVESDASLLAQYADLLAMRAGNKLEGRPLVLVNKALALNPKHPMALMMAASAAYRRTDYPQAISYWEKVLTVLDPGSSDASQVKAEIADAKARAGLVQ